MASAAGGMRLFLRRPIRRLPLLHCRPARLAKLSGSTKPTQPEPAAPPEETPGAAHGATLPAASRAAEGGAAAPVSKTIPGPTWIWLEPISGPFRAYGRAQARRPYITQVVSTVVVYFLGDLSAQSLFPPDQDGQKPAHDVPRTLRAMTIGGLAAIPGYRWFLWLGKSFNYPSRFMSILTKVVVNQVMFTPIFNTYFFSMQALLSGATLHETWERVKLAVPVSWWNSCKLWPAVTAFSFTFVGVHYRSIFAGVIAIGWQTYLSHLNQRAARAEAIQHAEECVQPSMTHRRAAA